MIVNSLSLKNFRIHLNSNINFAEELNYIIGGNGQGKTSILEAIYFLCTTKNYKSASDAELVNFSKDDFEIKGRFQSAAEHQLRIYYSKEQRKKWYFKDGKQPARASEVVGKFPVVLLTPDDHAITQGYATDRRKFVDSIISQASDVYLDTLIDYNKTLRQRASLLNRIRETGRRDMLEELEAWNEKLVVTGMELINYRFKYIDEFNDFIKEAYNEIIGTREKPNTVYKSFEKRDKDIEKRFRELLKQKQEYEIKRGINYIGPHRDDFEFRIDKKNLRKYGSQGQHKTFQVALRFAQFFYLKEKSGTVPIFLLDDVYGELDKERAVSISNYLKKVGQAVVTITDFSNFSFLKTRAEDLTIKVDNGEISYA